MKIAAVFRPCAEGICLWPDSVMIRGGKPVFIPDDNGTYRIHAAECVRIDRLGKAIETRFARRYYNQVAPAAVVLPASASDAILSGAAPPASDIFFDGCVIIGDFAALPEMPFDSFDRNISLVSQNLQLKTGDLILTSTGARPTEAVIDRRYEIPLSSATSSLIGCDESQPLPILKFKIK